jgi:hypothetical protein
MKKYFKFLVSTLIVCIALIGCNKSELSPFADLEDEPSKSQNETIATDDSIKLGDKIIFPLKGVLTNLVSENFEYGGQSYYCFQLKLEKLYGNSIIMSKNGGGVTDCTDCLSYSINFKFFTQQKDGPTDETYTIKYLDDILSYYTAMEQYFADEKKTIAFLYGDITFDANLDFNEYKKYRDSQVRIRSGTLQLKKSDDMFQVSFNGETETGEQVSCIFNDTITFVADKHKENSTESFSITDVPENYILKDGKYHKLEDAYISLPYNSQKNSVRVLLHSFRDYYWYEINDNQNYEWYPGKVAQRGRQNAVVLQFQLKNIDQFQSKTFQMIPSEVITGSAHQFLPAEQVEKFPNDSMCIGFYHIAADMDYIEWMSFGYSYGFTDYFVLESGKLEITKQSSGYDFLGNFNDSVGNKVEIKFKTTGLPISNNN